MICKDCKEVPPNIVENFSSGDMVCGSCGLVLGERIIDTRSEWRTFQNDDQAGDDPSRVGDGANPLLNGNQLETSIAYGDGSAKGRELARAQNKVTHNKANKVLLSAYKEIGAYCDAMSVQRATTDLAKHLFKQVTEAGALKGKSQDALIAGCIVIACRQNSVGRSFKEIWLLTKVPKAEIGRVFKQLNKFFDNHNKTNAEANANPGGQYPFLDLLKLCSKLTRISKNLSATRTQLMLETSLIAMAVTLGLANSAASSRKSLQSKCKSLVRLQVVRHFRLLQLVSSCLPGSWALASRRKRYQPYVVSAMALFERRTSSFGLSGRNWLIRNGSTKALI